MRACARARCAAAVERLGGTGCACTARAGGRVPGAHRVAPHAVAAFTRGHPRVPQGAYVPHVYACILMFVHASLRVRTSHMLTHASSCLLMHSSCRRACIPQGAYIQYFEAIAGYAPWGNVTYTTVTGGARARYPSSAWTAAIQDVGSELTDVATSDFWLTVECSEITSFTPRLFSDQIYMCGTRPPHPSRLSTPPCTLLPPPAPSSCTLHPPSCALHPPPCALHPRVPAPPPHRWVPRPGGDDTPTFWEELTKVFEPFEASAWGMLIGVTVAMSLLNTWLLRHEEGHVASKAKRRMCGRWSRFGWFDGYTWSKDLMVSIIHVCAFNLNEEGATTSQTIAYVGWSMFLLLTLTAYTANLAAFLVATPSTNIELRTLSDAAQLDVVVCTPPGLIAMMAEHHPDLTFQTFPDSATYNSTLFTATYRELKCGAMLASIRSAKSLPQFSAALCELNLFAVNLARDVRLPPSTPGQPRAHAHVHTRTPAHPHTHTHAVHTHRACSPPHEA